MSPEKFREIDQNLDRSLQYLMKAAGLLQENHRREASVSTARRRSTDCQEKLRFALKLIREVQKSRGLLITEDKEE